MKYLLYCIFYTPGYQDSGTLSGVDKQPVFIVSHNGLSAAVSRIDPRDPKPDITRILAYKRVVEYLHDARTVIPMRYGSILDEEYQVIRLLEEKQRYYNKLLQQIDGCVEMGIRLMIACPVEWRSYSTGDDCRLSVERLKNREKKHEIRNSIPDTSGKCYLAARKDYYEKEDRFIKDRNTVIDRVRASFTGLFIKCKTETTIGVNRQSSIANHQSLLPDSQFSTRSLQLVSLYFLVPRVSIDPFRSAFRKMAYSVPEKMLLSGPWPPYNFVMPDRAQNEWEDVKQP
jgi:hypothetical protein